MATKSARVDVRADHPVAPVRPVDSSEGKVRQRKPGAGRRRDPKIDQQILDGARQVYMEFGWEGFKFDSIAKAASVSRDALYRRYGSLEELLWEVLVGTSMATLRLETHDVRAALHEFGGASFDYFSSGDGSMALRVHLEALRFPKLYRDYRDQILDPAMAELRENVKLMLSREGVDLDRDKVQALVETINGAVMFHALLNQATEDDRERTAASRGFVKILIDQALVATGLVHLPSPPMHS